MCKKMKVVGDESIKVGWVKFKQNYIVMKKYLCSEFTGHDIFYC